MMPYLLVWMCTTNMSRLMWNLDQPIAPDSSGFLRFLIILPGDDLEVLGWVHLVLLETGHLVV